MKRIHALILAAMTLSTAYAQDITLTVAAGTSQVSVTLPAGEYIVNEQNVTSTGEEMTIDLNGASQASFKKADGTKVTAFAAVNQPGITGVSGSGSGILELDLHGNAISEFKYNPNITNGVIKRLYLNDNQLSSLTFTGNRWNAVEVLDVCNNDLSSLAIGSMTSLKQLYCSNNRITTLNISKSTGLTTLWCDGNNIKSLTLDKNPLLESLVADNNEIASIAVPSAGLENLTDVWFSNNMLSNVAITGCAGLSTVNAANNDLESITLAATDDKLLFADFSGNKLTFASLYDVNSVINYLYEEQQPFGFEKDIYVHGDTVRMPVMETSLNGTKLTISTTWYDWDTDEALKKGTKTGSTGAYGQITANKEYFFKPNFNGRAYATMTAAKQFPGLTMKSKMIRVMDQDTLDGVQDLKASGFTFNVMPGALRMSSDTPVRLRVVDAAGRVVWNGTVDNRGVEVDGLSGAYVVGGIKVVI